MRLWGSGVGIGGRGVGVNPQTDNFPIHPPYSSPYISISPTIASLHPPTPQPPIPTPLPHKRTPISYFTYTYLITYASIKLTPSTHTIISYYHHTIYCSSYFMFLFYTHLPNFIYFRPSYSQSIFLLHYHNYLHPPLPLQPPTIHLTSLVYLRHFLIIFSY